MSDWAGEQLFESEWWGDCTNTFGEELKQTVYAELMGLDLQNVGGPGPVIEMGRKSILDIGGGPSSLLLKTRTLGVRTLVEPTVWPPWVQDRYIAAGIKHYFLQGEKFPGRIIRDHWDECWIYNVLQHTEDPALVVANALAAASVVRIFEWVDMPVSPGHPHVLTEERLNEWLGITGHVYDLDTNGCCGRAYVGITELLDGRSLANERSSRPHERSTSSKER